MAPVPAWAKEWRPLAKQLCTHISDIQYNEEVQSLLSQEALLLRADRVVGQLYSHRFIDTVPQDVAAQTEAIATKFRVHSHEDRATKLLQLAPHCNYQVLKLLLELATSPTQATDEDVAVDIDTNSRWKTVLEQEQNRQKEHKKMQDQLVEELFQISTNDEWYQAWEDSEEEEDDSDWGMTSSDGYTNVAIMSDSRQRNGKRSSEAMEDEEEANGGQEVMTEFSDEGVMQDEILCRYYPEVELRDAMDVVDEEDPTCVLETEALTPFTLERPWLLYEGVVKSASTNEIIPRRLIHEQTMVSMIFEALDGVDSFLFEFHAVRPAPSIFSVDFQTKIVKRSRRSLSVAVGHLSPLALHHILEDFAQAASELQLLRDFLEFIRHVGGLSEQRRCVTLEGLANSLSGVLGKLSGSIRKVEQEINAGTESEKGDPSPWAGVNSRQPTLLGIYGGLKETFKMISWLKEVLVDCFQGLADRHWHEIKRAEQAKCVLDSLYHTMELDYVEGVAADEIGSAAGGLSHSDVLLHLFIGALKPYLSLINRMIFERGHFNVIPLDSELFFATPTSMSVDAPPIRERNQSFREGLLTLAPFEVDGSLVPTFLKLMIDLMIEALASRQMTNRFLQHQQHTAEEPLMKPEQLRNSLDKLFADELSALLNKRNGGILSGSLTQGIEEVPPPSQQTILECVPFNHILERCLTKHLESKCRELNGEITDIFRDKMHFMEHVEALRMFVLMEQQDVFNVFSERMVAHMQENPVAWADSEKINSFHQSAVQGVFEDNSVSSSQRQIGGQLCVRVDFNRLGSATSGARIDIGTMKCLHFTFSAQQPLRVLFSASIMHKYSRLGVFLIQVKAVETALVKFKSTLRHRRCYALIDGDMRQLLIQIADMLHYTKSVLSYLTSQISSEGWSKYRQTMQSSRSLADMDATHEAYLDHLLNRFFLLEKHATVIQYIVTTFNHILRFVGQVDAFVSVVDRNMHKYFPDYCNEESEAVAKRFSCNIPTIGLLEHPDFRVLHSEMTRSSKEFKRQSHFLVVMLTAMQKHGASPHVNEIVTQLNYNYFYHQQEHRSRSQPPVQQQQQGPVMHTRQAPPLNRSGSLCPPPAPKKFSRTQSAHLS